MLFDLGPHLVDQALVCFGAPDSIHRERSLGPRRNSDRGRFRHHVELSRGERQRDCWRIAGRAIWRATIPAILLHGTRGSFPQARARSTGNGAGWRSESSQAGIAGCVVARAGIRVGRADVAPNPVAPEKLVESRVKTELCDYRGFYANVRDAIVWRGAARFDRGGRISRDPAVGAGSPELRRGADPEGQAIERAEPSPGSQLGPHAAENRLAGV